MGVSAMAEKKKKNKLLDKFSIITMSLHYQLAIAFSAMTILPILALSFFLLRYLWPNIETAESIPLFIMLTIIISFLGFTVLRRIIKSISKLARYLENIARGDLTTEKIGIHNGMEINSIVESLSFIVKRLQQDRQEYKELAGQLEEKVKERTRKLEDTITALKRTEEEHMRLVAERAKAEEVKKRMDQLEKFTKVAVGRELKMKQMEKELNNLKAKL